MSAVAEPGKSPGRAGSRGARFSALGIGVIVTIHLAALAILLSTEYGPFAITLSLLAWAFMNCLLLSVLSRPAICAALALALTAVLIALRFRSCFRYFRSCSFD